MNSEQQLSFNYGMIMSVSASNGVCIVQTAQMQTEMKIPVGKVYQAIPEVGELWSYYRNGTTRVLHERIAAKPTDDEAWLFPGDGVISVKGTLHQKAQVIDQEDEFGEFFNPISHLLNPARQNGLPVYVVKAEDDEESVDGQRVVAPCILGILAADSTLTFKYKKS